jgi:hypothetical protein
MKIKNLFLICGSMIFAGHLTAEWALVDDFQDGNIEDWLFDTVNNGEGNALAAIPEPFTGGDTSNYVLEMDPGISLSEGPSSSATTRRVRAARAMPEINDLGTVYVRMAQPLGEGGIFSIINNVWGVGPAELDTIPNFNDFSALMRIEHTVHNYDVYDGTIDTTTGKAKGYQNVATELAMETWYEIWITIDHNNSAFAVYIRGGPEFPEQVKVYPAAEGEMAGYRNLTFDPMATFMIIATTGTIGDVRSVDNFYVDDIYVDTTGVNLSSPVAANDNDPLIGGTPVDGLPGWFLSEWLGYYNTDQAPWIFHAEHGWIYRDPSSTNAGTFFYDDAMPAWWYTNETDYPYIYAFATPADNAGTAAGDAWLWYFEDSKTPRSFAVITGTAAGGFLYFNP